MAKVSIIIPVYGVEEYIERCAKSLFEQTLDDIEYLFVDDNSQDRSVDVIKQVLEKYPQRKSQVIIHHMKQNSGVAKVREWGMRNASGIYIAHCDSDDWIEPEMYETMYNTALKEDSDIVVCDFNKTGTHQNKIKKGCISKEKSEFVEDLVFKRISWALWNKLFKRSLYISKFQYPQDNMAEDMAIVLQLACKANKISYTPCAFYNYYVHTSSLVRTKSEAKCIEDYFQQKNNVDIVLNVLSTYVGINLYSGYDKFLLFIASINLTPIAYHNKSVLMKWREFCPKMDKYFYFNHKIKFYIKFKYIKLSLLYLLNKNN